MNRNNISSYLEYNYYSGGMVIPDRNFSYENYGFGFNGKMKDDEIRGSANSYDYGYRFYDPRLSRFFSVDPLFKSYPWNSVYAFAENQPIWAIDIEGLEKYVVINKFSGDKLLSTSVYSVGNIVDNHYIEENLYLKDASNSYGGYDAVVINQDENTTSFHGFDALSTRQNYIYNKNGSTMREIDQTILLIPDVINPVLNSRNLNDVDYVKKSKSEYNEGSIYAFTSNIDIASLSQKLDNSTSTVLDEYQHGFLKIDGASIFFKDAQSYLDNFDNISNLLHEKYGIDARGFISGSVQTDLNDLSDKERIKYNDGVSIYFDVSPNETQ